MMGLDSSDYYPYTPGSGCDPEGTSEECKSELKERGLESEERGLESNERKSVSENRNDISDIISISEIEKGTLAEKDNSSNDNVVKKIEVRTAEDDEPKKGFMTAFSHFLSWVFSPVIVPTYAIICVFYLSMLSYAPTGSKWAIIGIVFALTAVIPGLAVWVLTKFGDVSDMALSRQSDRLIPYIVEGACMLACGYYLTTTGLPKWVGYFFIGGAIATAINLIVNFWWKISAHGAGMGGLIAMFLVMNRYGLPPYNLWVWCLGAVMAGGLLGMARVWLGRHTPLQTVAGEIVGFLGVMSMEFIIPQGAM